MQGGTDGLLHLGLVFEKVDFVLESIVDLLFLSKIERSIRAPRNLRIRKKVHVVQFWF